MRRDRLYLDDVVEAAEAISGFLAGVTEEQFLASDLLQSAVLQKLTIIGEAPARLSPEFKASAPTSRGPTLPPSATLPFTLISAFNGRLFGLRRQTKPLC